MCECPQRYAVQDLINKIVVTLAVEGPFAPHEINDTLGVALRREVRLARLSNSLAVGFCETFGEAWDAVHLASGGYIHRGDPWREADDA